MATYNLSAIADRARYLESKNGLSKDESKQKALKEAGFNEEFSQEIDTELTKLINNENMTEMSMEHGDGSQLIDRNQAGSKEKYDVEPTEQQEQ